MSKIEHNHSYLKKLGLDGSNIIKNESVCKKKKNKIMRTDGNEKNEYIENARPKSLQLQRKWYEEKIFCMLYFLDIIS